MRHEAKGAEAIVEVDEDGAAPGDALATIKRHAGGPDREPAAVNVDEHRQPGAELRVGGRPDIHVEAVLARRLLAKVMVEIVAAKNLDAFGRKAVGVVYTDPGLQRLRLSPSQLTNRWRNVGDAEIRFDAGP